MRTNAHENCVFFVLAKIDLELSRSEFFDIKIYETAEARAMIYLNYLLLSLSVIFCFLNVIYVLKSPKFTYKSFFIAFITNIFMIIIFFGSVLFFLFYIVGGSIEVISEYISGNQNNENPTVILFYITSILFEECAKLAMVYSCIKYAGHKGVSFVLCFCCGIIFGATEGTFKLCLTVMTADIQANGWLFNLPVLLSVPFSLMNFHGLVSSTYSLPFWKRFRARFAIPMLLSFATLVHLTYNFFAGRYLVGGYIDGKLSSITPLIFLNLALLVIYIGVRFALRSASPRVGRAARGR